MQTVTHAEAETIDRVSQLAAFCEDGIITKSDVVTSILHNLSFCPTVFAAEQCVARLPQQFHDELTRQLSSCLSNTHPGKLFVFQPIVPTHEELLELDNHVWTIGNAMLGYLDNPTGQQEYKTDPLELPRTRWNSIQQYQTIDGQYCKHDNCGNCRIKLGVFCPKHHFEMLYSKPPPNAT